MSDSFPIGEPVTIVNVTSGRVLDADTGTIGQDGTIVQLYGRSATGLANRQWLIVSAGGSNFCIVNKVSLRYLDADTATIGQDGTKIQLYGKGLPAPQNRQWQLVDVGADRFEIHNLQSGRVLDADTSTLNADGTRVQLFGQSSLRIPSRQWRIMRPAELDAANLIAHSFQDAPTTFDLLIITPFEFAGLFDAYQEAKLQRGVRSHLISLHATADGRGGVLDDFSGCDHPERIKTAIELAYRDYGARYVMLVGDASLLPVRWAFSVETPPGEAGPGATVGGLAGFQDGSYRPYDLYYSSLYHHGPDGVVLATDPVGTVTAAGLANPSSSGYLDFWNYNGDDKYNEKQWAIGALSYNPDLVDGKPDLAVGRVPARTAAEVQAFLQKVIAYEASAQSRVGPKPFAFIADHKYPGESFSDSIAAAVPPGTASTTTFTDFNLPAGQAPPAGWTAATPASFAELVGSSWWISYVGHGYNLGWDFPEAGSGPVSELSNGPNYPIVYACACETGQFTGSIPPDNPYADLVGNFQWYWMDTGAAPGKQIWSEDPNGNILGYLAKPLTVPTPNAYDLVGPADHTVACAWLFNASGGGIAYFGGTIITQDDVSSELETDFVESFKHLGQSAKSLGDLWLSAQQTYWQDNCQNNDAAATFRHPRVYLGIMTFFGDPSLQLV
jgi:Peptidase family C25/Ricin-type beta-trefoil lectin domain-like